MYFIATRLLRDAGAGPTILVSPLLALMRNQIRSAERAGGRCMACTGMSPEASLDEAVVAKAREHLRWAELMVEPRLQWPSGLAEPKGRIPEELRLRSGRALSVLNDGGWGGLVRKGLEAGEFSDALVEAAAELVGKRWRPDPPPTWVTCVPSSGVSPVPRVRRAAGGRARPAVPSGRREDP